MVTSDGQKIQIVREVDETDLTDHEYILLSDNEVMVQMVEDTDNVDFEGAVVNNQDTVRHFSCLFMRYRNTWELFHANFAAIRSKQGRLQASSSRGHKWGSCLSSKMTRVTPAPGVPLHDGHLTPFGSPPYSLARPKKEFRKVLNAVEMVRTSTWHFRVFSPSTSYVDRRFCLLFSRNESLDVGERQSIYISSRHETSSVA